MPEVVWPPSAMNPLSSSSFLDLQASTSGTPSSVNVHNLLPSVIAGTQAAKSRTTIVQAFPEAGFNIAQIWPSI